MKKLFQLFIVALTMSTTSAQAGDWVAPLLGGIIIGNVVSGGQQRHHHHYYTPPPAYVPPPRYFPPPYGGGVVMRPSYSYSSCGYFPAYDMYGYYVGNTYQCR